MKRLFIKLMLGITFLFLGTLQVQSLQTLMLKRVS